MPILMGRAVVATRERREEVENRGRVRQRILDATAARYRDCRCEELGLEAGMATRELVLLGSGCTGETIDGRRVRPLGSGGWVCPRLDTIRRHYGL
jgi:hypothetical protein